MQMDAVAIGAIVSVVLTIAVIGVIVYKVIKNMEDGSDENWLLAVFFKEETGF